VGLPSHKKIGNRHLKWAFSEAAVLLLRESAAVKGHVERLTNKYSKGKALGINRSWARPFYSTTLAAQAVISGVAAARKRAHNWTAGTGLGAVLAEHDTTRSRPM
jgi:hypothetical protein